MATIIILTPPPDDPEKQHESWNVETVNGTPTELQWKQIMDAVKEASDE